VKNDPAVLRRRRGDGKGGAPHALVQEGKIPVPAEGEGDVKLPVDACGICDGVQLIDPVGASDLFREIDGQFREAPQLFFLALGRERNALKAL
jgi:hypothetical protein